MRVGNVLQAFFSRQLAHPSGLFGRFFTARWLDRANAGMNSLTLDSLELRADDRLLEAGFGSAYLLEQVLKRGLCASVAGLDVSSEMVGHARRRLRRHITAGRARIRHGGIEAIPFGDGEFSAVCSVNTLYFWDDVRQALTECRRVLAAGGRLAICFNAKQDMLRWPGHVHGFTLYEVGEVETLLAGCGFSAIKTVSRDDPQQGLIHCVGAVAA